MTGNDGGWSGGQEGRPLPKSRYPRRGTRRCYHDCRDSDFGQHRRVTGAQDAQREDRPARTLFRQFVEYALFVNVHLTHLALKSHDFRRWAHGCAAIFL